MAAEDAGGRLAGGGAPEGGSARGAVAAARDAVARGEARGGTGEEDEAADSAPAAGSAPASDEWRAEVRLAAEAGAGAGAGSPRGRWNCSCCCMGRAGGGSAGGLKLTRGSACFCSSLSKLSPWRALPPPLRLSSRPSFWMTISRGGTGGGATSLNGGSLSNLRRPNSGEPWPASALVSSPSHSL